MSGTEYPKTLHHPHARKGTARPIPGTGKIVNGQEINPDHQGTADFMPPITVRNADQEAMERARGYLAFGEAPPAMASYSEYPLTMAHPQHADAVAEVRNPFRIKEGGPVEWEIIPGTPERFPHVTANDADEEDAWRAKGYERPGRADPDAHERHAASPYVPGRVTSEWPKLVNGVLMQDPSLPVAGPVEYPKWISSGRDPATGDPIGKEVKSRDEEAVFRQKMGMPPLPDEAAPPIHPVVQAVRVAAAKMSHGDKIKAGRARKKAEREAAGASA